MADIITSTITKTKKVHSITEQPLRAYMYPVSKRHKSGIYNPYIDHFMQYSEENYKFVNRHDPSAVGLFHVLRHINDIDVLFLNWIEKLPDLKGGLIQTAFLFFLLSYCKFKEIKIVWTMHNNIAHTKKNLWVKKIIFKKMIQQSDLIITHCKEGISIVKEHIRHSQNVFYFPHPVVDNLNYVTTRQQYDILIWGSLVPYKGVLEFLDFLAKNNLNKSFHIKIIGKCQDQLYFQLLNAFSNDYIRIYNTILSDNELKEEMRKARVVLFTYSGESVLSSGALAESLSNGAMVIGPYKAAFKDLADLSYIFCYKDFEALIPLLKRVLAGELTIPRYRFSNFLKEYHWSEFSRKMHQKIYQNSHAKLVF